MALYSVFWWETAWVRCTRVKSEYDTQRTSNQHKFHLQNLSPRVLEAGLRLVLRNSLNQREASVLDTPKISYTDDSAMTMQVAKSLINFNPENYQKELALNLAREYFTAPTRGYGASVKDLFIQMKRNKFSDVLTPAANQFGGSGSFGNGSAMRVSPVALYCLNKSPEFLVDLVKKTSEITHTNSIGINGAILQALAIHKNLKMNPSESFDKTAYLDDLLAHFATVEKGCDEMGIPEEKYFTKQLNEIKHLLNKPHTPSDEEVVNLLGHSVNALYSVPTALYCFLRNVDDAAPVRTTLEYTIGLGGDADTIASMSLALTGSLHGAAAISDNLVANCESSEIMIELADRLCGVSCETNN